MKSLQSFLKLSVTVTLLTLGSAEIGSSLASAKETHEKSSFTRSEYNSQTQLFAETLKSTSPIKSTESLAEQKYSEAAVTAYPTNKSTGIYLFFGSIIAGILLYKTCFVRIRQNKVGIKYKKFGSPLPSNRQIAMNGEIGFQIDTLNPGRHFLFPPGMYEVSTAKAIQVDTDEIGIVKAKDGASLPPGKMFGKMVECDDFQNGREFINQGGQRGQQLGILRNGIYRLNTKLFEVEKIMITHIHDGEIGLVEAKDGRTLPAGMNFGDNVDCHNFEDAQAFIDNGGYRGKQLQILTAGKYAINTELFRINRVDTISIGTDEVGILEAKYGKSLELNQNFGRVVDCNSFQDAQAFINNGGQRGKQLKILAAGTYDINTELFKVFHIPVVNIPAGEIGLIVAQDGAPKASGQMLGNAVDCNNFQDAEAFIRNGGQKGKQKAILSAGTYKINTALFTVITSKNAKKHDMKPEDFKTYKVESDKIGIVTTFDGKPLASGNIAAPVIDGQNKFQNVQQFIDAGGYRGLQEEILEEGSWKLNPWFAQVKQIPLTKIQAGTVGVVISNIGKNAEQVQDKNTDKSRLNIVPKGYKGIEETPLEAGKYPINTRVKSIEIVPTHDITLDWTNKNKKLSDYDSNLKTLELHSQDGFSFELEVTQVINIVAKNAPKLISRVGSPKDNHLDVIVDKIVNSDDAVKYSSIQNLVIRVLEPMVGSYFRDAAQKFDALDFLKNRDEIQAEASQHIKMALNAYGVQAVSTLINEINLPEELEEPIKNITIAQVKRNQLIAEQETEEENRKLEEKQRVTEFQAKLVEAKFNREIAEEKAQTVKLQNNEELRVLQEKNELEQRRRKQENQTEIDKQREQAQIESTRQEHEKIVDLHVKKETINAVGPERYAWVETERHWAEGHGKAGVSDTVINGGNGKNSSDGLSTWLSSGLQMQVIKSATECFSNSKSNNSRTNILQSGNRQPNIFPPEQSNPEKLIGASSDDAEED